MVTSYFTPEMEMWPCCAGAMKNMQSNPHLLSSRRNSCVLQEIGVEEDDGDVRFQTGSGIIAILRMRSEKYAI